MTLHYTKLYCCENDIAISKCKLSFWNNTEGSENNADKSSLNFHPLFTLNCAIQKFETAQRHVTATSGTKTRNLKIGRYKTRVSQYLALNDKQQYYLKHWETSVSLCKMAINQMLSIKDIFPLRIRIKNRI